MKRMSIFAYGILSYALFFGVFCYSIGFIGNLVVPKSIDSVPTSSVGWALLVNAALLAVFALQHSVMARPAFKRAWTRIVPPEAERSTYVLFSSLALVLVYWGWQPLGGTIWEVESAAGRGLLYGGYFAGWALVFVATFQINHFDLFGLRQVWLQLRGREYTPLPFRTPFLYRIVRHPLYVGWFMVFWFTPTMTSAHLFFALLTSAYILVAIPLEEKDLADALPEYSEYRRRVPKLLPRLRRAKPAPEPQAV